MKQLKVFEAFAGYGSQNMALKPLNIPFVVVGISKIDQYAIQAYNAIHGDISNYGDICKIDWRSVSDFDLFTYSFPCTDISTAGQQKGISKGSNTRSSLLWECERAIETKRPKYLLMENVKALTQEKFRGEFGEWQNKLSRLGYTNYMQVLNAKDYGVPQNRERVFMVSILGDDWFNFPQPIKLEKCLADVLEDEVGSEYYLSQKLVDGFLKHRANSEAKGRGFKFEPRDVSQPATCISTQAGSRQTDNFIHVKREGIIPYPNSSKAHQSNTIYSVMGLCPTTDTCGGGNREPKILQAGNLKADRAKFTNPNDGRVYDASGISPCLNTCGGGGRETKILGYTRDIKGKVQNYHEKDLANTVHTSTGGGGNTDQFVVCDKAHIRKLTNRECFRLMDVSDEDIDKIQATGISKTQQYKMAGNSIVVKVLEKIFEQMFLPQEQLTLFG